MQYAIKGKEDGFYVADRIGSPTIDIQDALLHNSKFLTEELIRKNFNNNSTLEIIEVEVKEKK